MYINFKILETEGMDFNDLLILQLAKQNKNEDLSALLDKFEPHGIEPLIEKGYLTQIKGKKGFSRTQKLRISKEGSVALDNIETPEILPEDIVLFDWISSVYTNMGKTIGNKKKTKIYIAEFRVQSGIEKNELAHLMQQFLQDDENMAYNNKLEYALFRATNAYQTKFNLDESRLWQYYQKNKESIDLHYERHSK